MKKPRYSLRGYLRRMQMSRCALFIFVEGPNDRYIYSKIVEPVCQKNGVTYEISSGNEIDVRGGGKEVLLGFFDYLKRHGSLIDSFKGKITISIFFLDKDVDDWLRTKRHSEHIVYTETYEIENYLFIHGDLAEAAAASVSLDVRSVRTRVGDYDGWRQRSAEKWKEWVKLCLFSNTHRIKCVSNYGQPASRVNDDPCGSVNRQKLESHLRILQEKSGVSPTQFERSFGRLSRKVDTIYAEMRYDSIFKGRWYMIFLVAEIESAAGARQFNRGSLSFGRLLSGLAQTLDFNSPWARHFTAPVSRLLQNTHL